MASMRTGEEALRLSPFFKTANMHSEQMMGKQIEEPPLQTEKNL